MGVVVVLTLWTLFKTNTLNAYHRVEALATNSAVSAFLGSTCSILCIMVWHEKGIVPSLLIASLVSWLVARHVLRKVVGPMPAHAPLTATVRAAGTLIRFCGPYTASMLFGTGVQMVLPVLVLHTMGPRNVGYYRAAVSISGTYLGFIITAMAQDYFPRVSAVSDQPGELCDLINRQQRLILLLGLPIILGTLALVPLLVPLVYSFQFTPTVNILEWQLIGDIFKFSSWTMSYVILARCSSATYFLIESISGMTALGTTWLGIHFFGLAGLGMSFVITYLVYYLLVWTILRRSIGMVWTKANIRLLIVGVLAGVLIRILPDTPLHTFRTLVGILLAGGAALWSLDEISHEVRSGTSEIYPLRTIFKLLNRIRRVSEV
jgi:PST family polysaccharide transporter